MIAYLTKQDLFWDLTCEDGSRFKLWWVRDYDKLKALEKAKLSFKDLEIELADWRDANFKLAQQNYEWNTGMPYHGRCEK